MTPPKIYETAFNCPHCFAYANQVWHFARGDMIAQKYVEEYGPQWAVDAALEARPVFDNKGNQSAARTLSSVAFSECAHCLQVAVWHGDRLVLPKVVTAPPANPDMPQDVKEDYEEAAAISDTSARGAAALLRLALQKLCKHLGEPGKNIDKDIASLVQKGLDVRVQQALDAVRVIGNESVHPGTIDLRDDRDTATMLFRLLNLVVDKMISEPKQVQAVYDLLPQAKRDGIARRDKQPS